MVQQLLSPKKKKKTGVINLTVKLQGEGRPGQFIGILARVDKAKKQQRQAAGAARWDDSIDMAPPTQNTSFDIAAFYQSHITIIAHEREVLFFWPGRELT